MINLQAKIHDKFTMELKVGFVIQDQHLASDFVMNTWIFIPHSLDINAAKYSKESFYRDIKSDVRLITPSYTLRELATDDDIAPLAFLRDNCETIRRCKESTNSQGFEHSVKMFCAVIKSALRNASNEVQDTTENKEDKAIALILDTKTIIDKYRSLRPLITHNEAALKAYSYGDEFLSNIYEYYIYRLSHLLEGHLKESYTNAVRDLLIKEKEHKKDYGYMAVEADDERHNSDFVYRASLLKKFIESDLFLKSDRRKNTFVLEQIMLSASAGIAMIFATIASFFFQQRFGNFTFPFFVALVVSYMFKDRIKELMKYLLTHKVSSKIFDNKTIYRINDEEIGWCKDSFDFVRDEKVISEVREKRNRNALAQAVNNRDEKIILFRKRLRIWRDKLAKQSPYPLRGINEVLRFNLTEYVRKMDNPHFDLNYSDADGNFGMVRADKIYYINFVIQCVFEGVTTYKRIIVSCNRDGIQDLEVLD